MDFQQTLAYLYSALPMYQRVGASAYKKNLDNTLSLCEALENPQKRFKSIHIAGTNGKGSSAHMTAAILQSAGYKTGLYTSPHLKSFTERIRINGKEISEATIVDFVKNHKALIEKVNPSFFEITVVMAFEYFATQKVDIAVIEVGLGGRLDSTNVIYPEVSLITNIGLDHQEMLGDTIGEIAFEKAGIIKKSVPVVIGTKHLETTKVFEQCAELIEATVSYAQDVYEVVPDNKGRYKVSKGDEIVFEELELQLLGDYQQYNIAGVLCTIDALTKQGYQVSREQIKNGLKETVSLTGIKGRWQVLNGRPLTICDTGHNLDGINRVVEQILRIPYKGLYIIWGMVNDKDSEDILKLLPTNAYYYFCQANVPRAKSAEMLYNEATQVGLKGEIVEKVNRAIELVKQQSNEDDLIFIGGSTFIVAEIEDL